MLFKLGENLRFFMGFAYCTFSLFFLFLIPNFTYVQNP